MTIKYTRLSEYDELKGTSLQVCNETDVHFSVLQYKARGELLYSHDRGMYSENADGQKGQMEAFLKLARKEMVDLAIAPEASVPWEIIQKILAGDIKPPRKGKLWFLGMEGIPLEDFEDTLDMWKKRDDLIVISSEIEKENKYVNAAIYLFLAENGKSKGENGRLALIIQVKTGGMRDYLFENEQHDLTFGKEVFLLDLNGEAEAQNIAAGMICADIFHINCTDFCSNFHGKSPLVLHIQMNPKPYYKEMAVFRNTFFRDSQIGRSQVITANWGRYTSIRQEGSPVNEKKKKEFTDSGSTVYMNLQLNHESCEFHEILKQESFIRHVGETQKSGFEYFLTEKYEIWKLQEAIDIVCYRMKKGFCTDRQNTTTRGPMPYIIRKYGFDGNGCLSEKGENTCDCSEMQELFDIFERDCQDMEYCVNRSCKECRRFYVDTLISLCLGEEIQDEYMASGEKSVRAVQTLYQNCKDKDKKNLLYELVAELKKRNLPERFGDFNTQDSFLFAINEKCARTGGDYRYNLNLKKEGGGIRRLLVVYIGHKARGEAQKRFCDMQNSVHEDMRDKILLYYSDSSGIKAYDEPYTEESILKENNDFSKNMESYLAVPNES